LEEKKKEIKREKRRTEMNKEEVKEKGREISKWLFDDLVRKKMIHNPRKEIFGDQEGEPYNPRRIIFGSYETEKEGEVTVWFEE